MKHKIKAERNEEREHEGKRIRVTVVEREPTVEERIEKRLAAIETRLVAIEDRLARQGPK
ncbi:MAG: hypothetical protein H5U01_01225 [Clostridia bacterium]|nr:hypothetical protein [Clostridia bacterium]